MMRFSSALLLCALLFSFPVQAAQEHTVQEHIKYYPDPVYKKFNKDDHHPMDDMLDLARQGDVRAQFIIGDLYSKGKGGFAKDFKEAHRWFEQSAMRGYPHSFIRLAAIAKHEKNFVEAWQWYTLGIRELDGDEEKYAIDARNTLVHADKLTDSDIKAAQKSVSAWEDWRDDQLKAEREAARKKERQQKSEADKTAAGKTAEVQPNQKQPPATGAYTNE